MILAVLWIQFTINTLSIGISDPGYLLEGDDTDCENMKFCSIEIG